MKLFIVEKHIAESFIGEQALRIAHQDCYKQLRESLMNNNIPLTLVANYDEENGIGFYFKQYDRDKDIYFYCFEFTIGG